VDVVSFAKNAILDIRVVIVGIILNALVSEEDLDLEKLDITNESKPYQHYIWEFL